MCLILGSFNPNTSDCDEMHQDLTEDAVQPSQDAAFGRLPHVVTQHSTPSSFLTFLRLCVFIQAASESPVFTVANRGVWSKEVYSLFFGERDKRHTPLAGTLVANPLCACTSS